MGEERGMFVVGSAIHISVLSPSGERKGAEQSKGEVQGTAKVEGPSQDRAQATAPHVRREWSLGHLQSVRHRKNIVSSLVERHTKYIILE